MRKLTVLIFMLALSGPVTAEQTGHAMPAHDCAAPVRPADDQNDVMWQRFLGEINEFRRCVNDEMDWHQRASASHQAKAREIVESWNQFVTTSLNAPEDFPWPPEDQ